MTKPIVLRTADIYLRFPEIMQEEIENLAEFLEDEHIVCESATDIFIFKDKEIDRLNHIIDEIEEYLYEDEWTSVNGEIAVKLIKNKLKELKEEGKNDI